MIPNGALAWLNLRAPRLSSTASTPPGQVGAIGSMLPAVAPKHAGTHWSAFSASATLIPAVLCALASCERALPLRQKRITRFQAEPSSVGHDEVRALLRSENREKLEVRLVSAFQEMVDLRAELRAAKSAGDEAQNKLKAMQSELFKADMQLDEAREARSVAEKKLQKAQQDSFKMDMKIQQIEAAKGELPSPAAATITMPLAAPSLVGELELPADTPAGARTLIEKLQMQADGMRITMRAMEKQLAQAQELAQQSRSKKGGFFRRLFGR
eukprot:CAMPEP_0115230162 /NCGR_PEP_ID=MMETSP0270-20121206/32575_1 /TAXON_ID=71861 /ORGANISM="Scrippsiella trochoidea, Strain CCMP3099" /LENGTH=269 /DNA_ID=CAMNT_0002644749 /DNA_START=70 /DNA_END=879 /DNA_ORIENTATION=-